MAAGSAGAALAATGVLTPTPASAASYGSSLRGTVKVTSCNPNHTFCIPLTFGYGITASTDGNRVNGPGSAYSFNTDRWQTEIDSVGPRSSYSGCLRYSVMQNAHFRDNTFLSRHYIDHVWAALYGDDTNFHADWYSNSYKQNTTYPRLVNEYSFSTGALSPCSGAYGIGSYTYATPPM